MFFSLALAAVPDFIKKALLVLGLGWISSASVTTLFAEIQTNVVGMYNNIPASVLILANMGGIPECIGIVLGAMLARLSFMALEHIGKVV